MTVDFMYDADNPSDYRSRARSQNDLVMLKFGAGGTCVWPNRSI